MLLAFRRRRNVTEFAMSNATAGRRDVSARGKGRHGQQQRGDGQRDRCARRELVRGHRERRQRRHRVEDINEFLRAMFVLLQPFPSIAVSQAIVPIASTLYVRRQYQRS